MCAYVCAHIIYLIILVVYLCLCQGLFLLLFLVKPGESLRVIRLGCQGRAAKDFKYIQKNMLYLLTNRDALIKEQKAFVRSRARHSHSGLALRAASRCVHRP